MSDEESQERIDLKNYNLSDYGFILSPGRPPRRIFDIEEAVGFTNEIGQALLRERRRSNIIIGAFLGVLILVVILFVILFLRLYDGVHVKLPIRSICDIAKIDPMD